MPGEFEIIRNWFDRKPSIDGLRTGIGDDGAVMHSTADSDQVVVTDTLVKGRHYPADAAAEDIGYRAMAVNLSDLAAMGAEPRYAFLNLSLDEPTEEWLDGFAEGFFSLAERFNVALAGGDTTRGPETITVTLIGDVPESRALLRSGARVGDWIAVTGEIGRAAAALECWRAGREIPDALDRAWRRPEPRIAAGLALRGLATSCIDVSDGLVADLGHILEKSKVGATLDADLLATDASREAWPHRPKRDFLFSGDDYELCFTFAPDDEQRVRDALAKSGTALTVCGEVRDITAGFDVKCDGEWQPATEFAGWDHFRGSEK